MSFLLRSTCTARNFLEIRVVSLHTIITHGSGGFSPLILNFNNTFVSCFTHRRNSPFSALDRRISCLQSESGWFGDEQTCCLPEN
jgi:hypothetical protein